MFLNNETNGVLRIVKPNPLLILALYIEIGFLEEVYKTDANGSLGNV